MTDERFAQIEKIWKVLLEEAQGKGMPFYPSNIVGHGEPNITASEFAEYRVLSRRARLKPKKKRKT